MRSEITAVCWIAAILRGCLLLYFCDRQILLLPFVPLESPSGRCSCWGLALWRTMSLPWCRGKRRCLQYHRIKTTVGGEPECCSDTVSPAYPSFMQTLHPEQRFLNDWKPKSFVDCTKKYRKDTKRLLEFYKAWGKIHRKKEKVDAVVCYWS